MGPGHRITFLLLLILLAGWGTSIASHHDACSISQDELHDSWIQNNEAGDDSDGIQVDVAVPGLVDGILSFTRLQNHSITHPVLFLEARAPPYFL